MSDVLDDILNEDTTEILEDNSISIYGDEEEEITPAFKITFLASIFAIMCIGFVLRYRLSFAFRYKKSGDGSIWGKWL